MLNTGSEDPYSPHSDVNELWPGIDDMGDYWGPVRKSYRVIRKHGPTLKHSLDIGISTPDTSGMVLSRLTAFLVLIAITLQGAMAGMQENVIICLGGGHEHGPTGSRRAL